MIMLNCIYERFQWLKEGDKNTILLFKSKLESLRRKKMEKIRDANGEWI